MIATHNLQSALYTTFTTDPTLMCLVTGVFDHLPQGTEFPYIVLGADTETDWSSMTSIGRECTVTIHIFSRYQGMVEAKQIAGRMCELVERQRLSALGVTTCLSILDLMHFYIEADGETRHGVVRFRFKVR